MKKLNMKARPVAAPVADNWVHSGIERPVPGIENRKRLTVDLEEEQHTKFKMLCAAHRLSMVEEIRSFIDRRIQELEKEKS